MNEWMPIDSAPKDGTRILVTDGFEVQCAAWVSSEYSDVFRWIVSTFPGGDYNDYLDFDDPTHWMPIPDLPAVEDT